MCGRCCIGPGWVFDSVSPGTGWASQRGSSKMLTCRDASRLVSEGQERPLAARERWGLRLHLWMCVNCRRFAHQVRFMRRALRLLAADAGAGMQDLSLPAAARERIRTLLIERRGGFRQAPESGDDPHKPPTSGQ
ncbi:MAG: zf-HC2 domain-containing protein [Gammaproteobacteria bacterium]